MELHEIELQRTMTADQRVAFQAEYSGRRKDSVVGVLLALFLGDFGAHRFYLGQTGLGVLYLVFFWTAIPALIALVECFFMPGRVERYNLRLADEIAAKVRLSFGGAPASPFVFCTKCGQQITADSRFCGACGAAVPVPAAR